MEEGRTKFVSKNANLRIVLEHAISENKLSGQPAFNGLYVRFQDGMVTCNQEVAEKMMKHSAYMKDFYPIAEEEKDRFAAQRKEAEPGHMIEEMEYGHPGKSFGTPVPVKFSPAQEDAMKKIAQEMAMSLVKEMAPQMAKEMLNDLIAKQAETTPNKVEIPVYPTVKDSSSTVYDTTTTTTTASVPVSDLGTTVVTSFVCPACSKVAKTKAGLAAHQRNCTAFHQE